MALELEAPPIKEAIAIPKDQRHPLADKLPEFIMGKKWVRYFSNQATALEERPARKAHTHLTAQNASLGVTPLALGSIPAGVWTISVVVRVTQAATISSEIQVTVHWTGGGVSQTESGTNLTGNTTATGEGKPFLIRVDADTPISFSTTYASAGATPMLYELDVVAVLLSEDAL